MTRRGEPIAVMTGIDHEVLEDFLLATAVREIADFEAAEEELASGATTAISDLLDPDKNTSKK